MARSADPAPLRRALLAWYRRNRRDLPWRRTSDAYAIWISEAMLQQTRVETVIDYWRRFLLRFPEVRALAAAREEDVLALWSGLGYYRRARSLHAAARAIVERHDGEFPRELDAVRELPGVGPYTAGAVLSIAFDAPQPLVDGNVARVFARLFAFDADAAATTRWAWERAREYVPSRGAGEWNQALMELGATVCTPREPRCESCPVRAGCEAARRGLARQLPRAKQRPAPIDVELQAFWVERGAALLFEQRAASGRMAGLWQLPTRQLEPEHVELFPRALALALEPETELLRVRHSITVHRITLAVVRARLARNALPPGWRWVTPAERAALPITGMTKKVLARQAQALALEHRTGGK